MKQKSSQETLYNEVLEIHSQRPKWTKPENSLAQSISELYHGTCLSINFSQKKNEFKPTMYC